MALPATTVWEVRTTGNDENGGGFNSARDAVNGVDYSQQDAPQLDLTDLACASGTPTVLTSVTGGFTHAMEGNIIQIHAGTNFTAGFYEIVTYTNTNTVTLDRTPIASGEASVGHGKVGGALASPGKACGAMVGGNLMWVKAGTYTVSSASANIASGCLALPAGVSDAVCTVIEGYNSTRGDLGTKPLLNLTVLTSAGNVVDLSAGSAIARNISISLKSNDDAGVAFNGGATTRAEFCNSRYGGNAFYSVRSCVGCYALDFSGIGFYSCSAIYCVADGGIQEGSATGFRPDSWFAVCHCIAVRCVTGFSPTHFAASFSHCTAYDCGDGFSNGAKGTTFSNCVAETCSGYGFTGSTLGQANLLVNCAGYNNTSGNYNATYCTRVVGFQNGSGSFFVDAAGNNFTPNATANAGALLLGAAWPTAFPGMSSIANKLDIGAAQHQETAGGGGGMPVLGGSVVR